MGHFPVALISALSDDLQKAVGLTYHQLRSFPALPPDSDHRLASAYSIASSFTKKFLPSDSSKQDAACLAKFLSANERSRTWSLRLNTTLDEELWGTFKSVLYNFFNPGGMPLIGSLDDIFLEGKCGPGASISAPNGDFYSKMFSSGLTCTSQGLVNHYLANIRRWPEWCIGETIRSLYISAPRIVQGSKLSFVPKSDAISRSICVEPVLNMFYQLGLGQIITRRLKSFFQIDLSTQPGMNADLACLGSVDGSLSTIDLESASDTISMRLAREVLPRDVWSWIVLLRSKSLGIKGNTHELHMVSTMGNGFTFPLQTVIFAAMVKAANITLNLGKEKVNVFGDDIICKDNAYNRVCRLLDLAGCVMNTAKSFNKGPFRESCGHDYFLGRNVRGVYIKSLDSLQDFYAAINAVNRFSARTGLVLRSVMNFLVSRVDRAVEIPPWEDPSSGIQLPYSIIASRLVHEDTQGTVYSKYCFKARKIRIKSGTIIFSRRGKTIFYNSSGLLIAFLSGMALSSGLPLRKEGKWRKERRSCSYWDSFEFDSGLRAGFDFERWETATFLNLLS